MMKRYLLILLLFFAGTGWALAQTRVTGTVTDSKTGETLPGVSVVEKGTNTAVVTDMDGKYAINVAGSKSVLVFSSMGHLDKEHSANASTINIKMHDETEELDQIVITAFGISKEKKALGYSVQAIKSDELIQAANTDLASAMQGKLSGIQINPSSGMPGASSQIYIRGARSFSENNTPLYVIDGMPVSSEADISTANSVTGTDIANRGIDVDPNDIESINILKGQAASALYGIRASNGVILITTKSGKNLAKGKAHVSFSSNFTLDRVSRFPDLQSTYAQGNKGNYAYNASTSWGPEIGKLPDDPTYGGNVANALNGGDISKYNGRYYVTQIKNADPDLDPWVKPAAYNNVKDFFQLGTNFSNSLNVAQSTDKGSFSISIGSANQKGIISSSGMDRYSGKLAAETKLSNKWKAGFSGNFVTTKIDKQPSANDGLMGTVYPTPPSYNLKGIPSHFFNEEHKINNYRAGAWVQPYWGIKNNKFQENTDRFFGNAFVEYATELAEKHKLTVKYQAGVDSYTTHYTDLWGYGIKGPSANGQIANYSWTDMTLNSLLLAIYDWDINDDFKFNFIAGNEFIQGRSKYLWSLGSGFQFPGWTNIANTTTKDNLEERWRKRTVGFFGNASLSYKNMLFLNITGRNDVVSDMPRNSRSFFYPSVSLGFVATELEALKNNDVLNFAKLRASYAQVGQAGDYKTSYYSVPGYGGGFYMFTPLRYPLNGVNAYTPYRRVYDPNLVPQNTNTYEFGIDLNFFNSLFGLNYTFARQNVKDQIFDIPLAGSTGVEQKKGNGGNIHTNSHEITLSVNPVRTKNVDWNFGFNWTKIDNYVDELAPGVESIMLGGFVTPQVRAGIGYKFPVIYGTTYLRDDKGNKVVGDNGIPLPGEPGIIGKVSPDFILGFNTSLSLFKRAKLAAVLDWKNGGQMYGGTNGLLDYYGMSKNTEDRYTRNQIIEGVKKDGTVNDIEIRGTRDGVKTTEWQNYYQTLNQGIDESSIYDNSFIKLREVSASYLILNKSKFQLTLSGFVRNILVWTNYPNLDPESSQGNNNMSGSFERFSLPQTTSYGLGLNVKF